MEAYVNGVSTRKVDRLVEQLGIQGMSKDRVSRLCRDLDEHVEEFRTRPLEGAYPYLWLDAKHLKVRDRGRVVSKALVVAYAVHDTGRREVIGLDLGEVETEAFWTEFLRGLRARGLHGLAAGRPITTKASKPAIARVLDAPWQRCYVHFVRNMHGHCRPPNAAWCPPRCARCSTPPTALRPAAGSADVLDRLGPQVRRRSASCSRPPRRTCWRSWRSPTALDQAPQHQPAGARQPRDRPSLRRRRHLPQRRLGHPPRRCPADRAERRVDRLSPLPLRGIHAPVLCDQTDQENSPSQNQRRR